MARGIQSITLGLKVSWWLRPYLWWLSHWYRVTGSTPNWDRLQRVVMRGLKFKFGD